jgi:hypothetical protein
MKREVQRRLFISATNQNDGKTTSSLGLVKGFGQLAKSVGFVKPVGQRYTQVNSQKIDEDSLLIWQACGLDCPPADKGSLVVEQDFTRKYLDNPEEMYPILEKTVLDSFATAAEGKDLVVIEGTGHAGVGTIFGLCNARVAKLVGAKTVIVTLGGIGRPVDEVAVNRSLFERENVPVIGVIVNKVIPEKLEQTHHYLSKAFANCGLPLLGVIPYAPRLAWPTVQQVAETMNATVVNGHDRLANPVAEVIIGAMTAHNAITYVHDKSLLIVPGDRDDVVLAMLSMDLLRNDMKLSGIVFTGGLAPQPQTMDLVRRTEIPVLIVDAGTYETAAGMRDVLVKIRVADEEKIQLAAKLVRDHVDLECLWSLLA